MHEKCAEFKNKTRQIDVTISLGSSTSLLCEVMYFTIFPSHFTFLKIVDQKFVNVGSNGTKNIYKIENKRSNIVKLINYTIVNASRNDTGTYKCDFITSNDFYCPMNLHKVFNVKGMLHIYHRMTYSQASRETSSQLLLSCYQQTRILATSCFKFQQA